MLKVNSNPVFFPPLVDWGSRRKRKIADITQALSVDPVDVATLRRMAISEGGLLTDEIRCQVWPRLLNVPPHLLDQEPGKCYVTNSFTYEHGIVGRLVNFHAAACSYTFAFFFSCVN